MNALTKAGKRILNAMAFANSGNLNEFNSLLNQIEPQSEAIDDRPKITPVSVVCGGALNLSAGNLPVSHAQQAL